MLYVLYIHIACIATYIRWHSANIPVTFTNIHYIVANVRSHIEYVSASAIYIFGCITKIYDKENKNNLNSSFLCLCDAYEAKLVSQNYVDDPMFRNATIYV